MVDYLKNGSDNDSVVEGISNLVDAAAVAGTIVGTAFLLSRTKQGAKFLSEVDPIIGKMSDRIASIGIDGSNRLSISETIRGISHIDQFRKIDQDFAINNASNVGLFRNLADAAYDAADWEERELGRQYQAKIFGDIGDELKKQGIQDGQVQSLMEFVSSRSTSTVIDKNSGKLQEGFIADVENHWHDFLEEKDAKFNETVDQSIQALQNISNQTFDTFSDFKSLDENIIRAREARQDFIQEINRSAQEALKKQKNDITYHTIGDILDKDELNPEFDFIVHEKGQMASLDGRTVSDRLYAQNDDIVTQTLDTIRQLSATKDGYYVEGQKLNTPNINKIIGGAKDLWHETLPYALSHAADFKNVDNLKVEYLNKYDFKGVLGDIVGKDSIVQRIGNRLFELKSDGTRNELDTSGMRFVREDSYVIKTSKDFSNYGKVNFDNGKRRIFGETSRKRTSDVWGNNYHTFLNKDIDEIARHPEEKAMMGIRNHSFKRSIDSLDIKVKLDDKLRSEFLKASEDNPGLRYKIESMLDVIDAKTESEKRRVLRDISTEGTKSSEFQRLQSAAIRGRSIKPKLIDDSTSITQKTLYAKLNKSQSIDEAAINEIMASLPADRDKALAFINKLNVPETVKLNLRDRYNVEQLKIRTNLNEITGENHVDATGKDLSIEDAKRIQNEIISNPELQRTLNRYLGSGKDYKARYESKKSSSRLIAINKGFDLKGIMSDLNKMNYNGIGNRIGQGLRGMFSNTNLDHFAFSSIFDNNVNLPTAKHHGRDLSIGGSLLYKMPERLNEGLNNGFIDQALGFVHPIFGERLSAYFKTGLSLGFHEGDTRSFAQLSYNLLFKRVLPASIALTQLDWANDTFGINKNFQIGLANMDLGFRKFTDATGLTDVFKLAKMANPAAQYISGDYRPYQSYEERLDYYQNGKDPIRSGRYWVWGSSNEFRGSSISYWEDNSLKLAQSDYYNKSVYGGYWSKWAHSPIPTLTNPLSPLVYAFNPYWLEEKHMEDRPYLLSAPLFEQGTLQSLVLNPTLGEIIKPQRRYHEDRMWFGKDVKAIMYQMNQKIQQTADEDSRYIIFQNGRLGVYDFRAFSHPTDTEYVQGQGQEYTGQAPAFASARDYSNYINSDGTIDASAYASLQPISPGVGAAVSAMNSAIQSGSSPYTNASGMYIQQRIRRTRSNKGTVQEMLDNADMYNNLMNSSGGRSYLDELMTTSRLLTGIYGYAGTMIFGRDESKFIADAGDINSFTRRFWDSGIGGVGGEQMEIIRRFLPEYSRRRRINPLMNKMAEDHPWLPEKFYTGDPFSSLPMGEARLPGEGYEAINQLHPDQFASDGYGAIDRYKILADIAPNSAEYKYWKQIVKMMNNDEAKKVLKDTEEMVKHQGKKHDFFDYKFLGKTTTALDGHIEQILSNGKFKLAGDDNLYQIAGVKFKDNGYMSKNQLKQVLTEGSHVTLRIDDEERNPDINAPQAPRKAAVFLDGENISDTLRQVGLADYDMEDTSAAGAYANYGLVGRLFGTTAEIVAHAPIPIIHSQLMRVNSPLEEYRSDQLYGTGFQSWDSMLASFVYPTFEQAKTDFMRDVISDSLWRFYKGYESGALTENISKRSTTILKTIATYSNGTALAGEIAGRFTFTGANSSTRRDQLANAGRHIGNIYSMVTSLQDPMYAAYAWGRMGWDSSKVYDLWKDVGNVNFDSVLDYAEHMNILKPAKLLSEETGVAVDVIQAARKFKLGRISQAIAFAAAGTALAVGEDNPLTRLFGKESHVYTPDVVKERWDTEDYFDRLRYIKYMALYEAAKEKAKSEEGVDIDKLYKHQEALRAEMNGDVSITDMMSAILTSGKPADDPIAQWVQKTFGRLSDDMTTLVAGKYTEQAIMFHQVAESTVYALNKNSEYSDIIRALPNTEKEYFVEFAKVTDERRRREILKNVSPSLAKALKLVWYQEDTETESNESFFERHNLPDPLWAGWDASTNLDNIKAKVIYNEGMQYADYGIYSSSYEDPEVINAPNIDNIHDGSNPLSVRMNLNAVLSGIGLTDKRIQVDPTQDEGVIQVVSNVTAVLGYKIEKAFSIFS
uniref:Uncharacterized protein n=1 Tax=virus sp. ctEQ64 TaxID=2825809 RepID=A0A8S5RKI5_9VIRU|nr:MAG TPA: hypothetical protein [virus sp. ctEQ64]